MIKNLELEHSVARETIAFPQVVPQESSRISRRRVLLLATDVALMLVSCFAVASLKPVGASADLATVAVGLAAVWATILYFQGFYNPKLFFPFHQRCYELFKTFCISILIASALCYLLPNLAISRTFLWASSLVTIAGLMVWRTLYYKFLPLPIETKRVLIVGAGWSGTHIAEEIVKHPRFGYQIVGYIDDDLAKARQEYVGFPVLDGSASMASLSRSHQIDAIILAVSQGVRESTLKAVGDCVELGCEILSVSDLYERISGRIPVRFITHSWFIRELNETNRKLYSLAKRGLDILLSAVGLLGLGLILPLMTLLIKLDSPGSVFYSQVRVGKSGRTFKIHKFRTMVADAERGGAVWARKNDNRVTRLGNFLRRTRIDELPQLFNVLRGEMSLVGPRPERPEFVETLADSVPFYNRRHMVLPGLTGWAQVNYPYGASIEDALQKLQYDLFYIKNRSLFLDLEIILRTVSVVLNRTGSR